MKGRREQPKKRTLLTFPMHFLSTLHTLISLFETIEAGRAFLQLFVLSPPLSLLLPISAAWFVVVMPLGKLDQ